MPSQNEIRAKVTRTIIEALERGGLPPWRRPWKCDPACGAPTNIVSRKPYRGINPLLLQAASVRHDLQSKYWGTFRQWTNDLGGQVKKRPADVPPGEWATTIVFWKPISKITKDDNGNERDETFFVLRSYSVLSIDQVIGDHLDHLRAGHNQGGVEIDTEFIEARRVIDACGADIRHGGNRAFYRPTQDYIRLPDPSQMDAASYYETAFHELAHWSESRLGWKGPYAMGELIAEMASCFLCSETGVPMSDDLGNHAAYLASWLKAMKEDSKYIFQASSQAAKAADFILSFSRATEPEEVLAE